MVDGPAALPSSLRRLAGPCAAPAVPRPARRAPLLPPPQARAAAGGGAGRHPVGYSGLHLRPAAPAGGGLQGGWTRFSFCSVLFCGGWVGGPHGAAWQGVGPGEAHGSLTRHSRCTARTAGKQARGPPFYTNLVAACEARSLGRSSSCQAWEGRGAPWRGKARSRPQAKPSPPGCTVPPLCARAPFPDPVGFVPPPPHPTPRQATLEEVTEADLLLHVLDASSPQVLAHSLFMSS